LFIGLHQHIYWSTQGLRWLWSVTRFLQLTGIYGPHNEWICQILVQYMRMPTGVFVCKITTDKVANYSNIQHNKFWRNSLPASAQYVNGTSNCHSLKGRNILHALNKTWKLISIGVSQCSFNYQNCPHNSNHKYD
jgi:hypothetical protein